MDRKDFDRIINYNSTIIYNIIIIIVGLSILVFALIKKMVERGTFNSEGLMLLLVIVGIFAIVPLKNLRKLMFHESLVFVCKTILLDNSVEDYKKDSSLRSAIYILDNKEKYYWNESEKLNMNEPYALSMGMRDAFSILQFSSQEHIEAAKKYYPFFLEKKILKIRNRAIEFYKYEMEKEEELLDMSFKHFLRTGNANLHNTLEKNFQDEQKKREDAKLERERDRGLKGFQLVTSRCPYCLKEIPRLATKCPHCTADL